MKTALILLAATAAAAAAPAAAQDFGRPLPLGTYADPYDDVPIPPRPVPGYRAGEREVVVTTTRRIVAAPPAYEYGYDAPRTVVTTRRVVAPAPVFEEPEDAVATGSLRPVAYPPAPPRRVLKSGSDFGPPFVGAPLVRERVVETRRVQPEPVVVEERRVVTTRRILHPAPAEPLDWDE
jgi:hypothetical protein